MSYETPKAKDYGVNSCEGCLDKQREIDRLKEEVQRLRLKVSANQRKSKEGFFGSSTPSSQIPVKADSLAENQAKRGGAQKGHRGFGRQAFSPDEADEQRLAALEGEICPDCASRLNRLSVNERSVYELERERVKKIYYSIERKLCPQCRRIESGKVAGVFPRCSLSNELVAEVAEQHYVLGRTLGQLADRFSINYSTLSEALKRIGKMLEPGLEKLKKDFRSACVRHADETGWRTDGASGWSWYFGTEDVSLHLFRETRSASVVREVFGSQPLEGVLVVDRYSGYNRVPCRIQYCYAHLLREMKDLEQEFESDKEVQNYTAQMKLHLTDAMRLRQRGLARAQYQRQASAIKSKILKLSDRQAIHPAVRRWQDFFVEKADRLYQWTTEAAIAAENNYAEREIRKIVIARKMSYGSQSPQGALKTRNVDEHLANAQKARRKSARQISESLKQIKPNQRFGHRRRIIRQSKALTWLKITP